MLARVLFFTTFLSLATASAVNAQAINDILSNVFKPQPPHPAAEVVAEPVVAPASTLAVAPVSIIKPARRPAIAAPEVKSPDSLEGIAFNHVGTRARLSSADAQLYAQIFALQDVGNFHKANENIKQLSDHRLMGHVLYQRYMSHTYKATYKELADWMRLYADHPGAQHIYDLARTHSGAGEGTPLAQPQPGHGLVGFHDYDSGQLAQPYLAEQDYNSQERAVMKQIDDNLSESPTVARRRLDTAQAKNVFEDTKYDALRANVAESYFYNNRVDEAYEQAAASSDRSGSEVPLAGWIAGLAAWRKGDYETAAKHFERTASSSRASAWTASAGAFWAARSYMRSHHPEKVSFWLEKAALHPRSFYGIIAVKALGMEQTRFNWLTPALDSANVQELASVSPGKRALALMDAEHPELAEREMRQISPDDHAMQEAMMSFVLTAGEPALAMRLGSGLLDEKGKLYDAALYPDAPWRPDGGWKVDKALVCAFIRQESKFEAGVENQSSGAVGVMQLMPATAMLMARRVGAHVDASQLSEPGVNIRLGQKYLELLLQDESVKNNLFKLAVAYNAGPGKLARWEKTVDYQNDPLLFIESIPVAETRLFVERVLTNYWIYRLKYNQSTDSLEMVASGEWPVYMTQDIRRGKVYASAGH